MGRKEETTMKVLLLLHCLGLASPSPVSPIAVPAGVNLDQDLSTLLSIFGPRDCRLPGTILNWHNGEPIGTRNNVDETGCKNACESTQDCAACTLNTQNGWCALKAENQIKKGANSGFVSEIRMATTTARIIDLLS